MAALEAVDDAELASTAALEATEAALDNSVLSGRSLAAEESESAVLFAVEAASDASLALDAADEA